MVFHPWQFILGFIIGVVIAPRVQRLFWNRWIRRLIALKAAEEAGFDSGKNGPNETNCHPRHFATRERTEAWERGRDRAKTPHSREGSSGNG